MARPTPLEEDSFLVHRRRRRQPGGAAGGAAGLHPGAGASGKAEALALTGVPWERQAGVGLWCPQVPDARFWDGWLR